MQENPKIRYYIDANPSFVDASTVVNNSIYAKESYEFFLQGNDVSTRAEQCTIVEQNLISPSHPSFQHLISHLEKTFGSRAKHTKSYVPNRFSTPLERFSRIVHEIDTLKRELEEVEKIDSHNVGGSVLSKQEGVFGTIVSGVETAENEVKKLSEIVHASEADPEVVNTTCKRENESVDVKSLRSTIQNIESMLNSVTGTIKVIQQELVTVSNKLDTLCPSE